LTWPFSWFDVFKVGIYDCCPYILGFRHRPFFISKVWEMKKKRKVCLSLSPQRLSARIMSVAFWCKVCASTARCMLHHKSYNVGLGRPASGGS
jgi:hypothetical protein